MSKTSLIVSLFLHSSFLLLFYVLDSDYDKANTNILHTEIIVQKDNQKSENKPNTIKYNDVLVNIKKEESSNDKIINKTEIKKNILFKNNETNLEPIIRKVNKDVLKAQTSVNYPHTKKFNKSKGPYQCRSMCLEVQLQVK